MEPWLSELKEIGRLLFERQSAVEGWFLGVVCVCLVLLVFKLTARVLTGGQGRFFFVFVPGFLLMALGAVAVRMYVSTEMLPQALGAFVVLLAIVVPLTRLMQRTSYLSALLVWVFTLSASIAVLYAADQVSAAIHKGARGGDRLQERRETLNDFLEGDR